MRHDLALREITRVLRRDGQLLFIEHVRLGLAEVGALAGPPGWPVAAFRGGMSLQPRANRLAAMQRKWFPAQPVDEAFFDTAPLRLSETFEIPRPAARVWADLTTENPLSWCRILREITWTSPRPFGVGTTRTARTLGNATVLHEHYFRWEEGRRQSFYVLESSVPFFRRLAEDYLVELTSETACRFTWTIAVELHPAARLTNPVNRLLLSTLLRDTRRHYGLG